MLYFFHQLSYFLPSELFVQACTMLFPVCKVIYFPLQFPEVLQPGWIKSAPGDCCFYGAAGFRVVTAIAEAALFGSVV